MMCIHSFGSKKPKKEIKLDALDENLDRALAFIDAELDLLDCSPKAKMQIDLAVEEIFVNVAHYAYAPGTGEITIGIDSQIRPSKITITFSDHGAPYDPLSKPDPDVTLSAEERRIGGLGIYLVKKNMDEMKYEYLNGKNVLTISKTL